MCMLHFGLLESTYALYGEDRPRDGCSLRTNLAYSLAETFVQRKTRAIRVVSDKDDFMGNLLTPLFQACNIDLSGETVDDFEHLMDSHYFRSARILRSSYTTYEYTGCDGLIRYCRLPISDLTEPTSVAAVDFDVPQSQPNTFAASAESSDFDDYIWQRPPIADGTPEMWHVYFVEQETGTRAS